MKITGILKRFLVYALFIIFFAAMPVLDQAVAGEEQDGFWVQTILRPPDFDAEEFDYSGAVERKFNLTGTLNAVFKDRIVVDDINIPLASEQSLLGVRQGNYIGVRLNVAGKAVEIHRLQYRK